jgi:hypothetical protein
MHKIFKLIPFLKEMINIQDIVLLNGNVNKMDSCFDILSLNLFMLCFFINDTIFKMYLLKINKLKILLY